MLSVISKQTYLTEPEMRSLFLQHPQSGNALQEVAAELGNRFEVDVCSIYVIEQQAHSLLLAATVGLNQGCVGHLRMGLDEGLAGMVAEKARPIAVAEAAKHPRFKYFPEAEEDAYESFLGVPIDTQGVLVVQTLEPRSYSPLEIIALQKQADLLGLCMRRA